MPPRREVFCWHGSTALSAVPKSPPYWPESKSPAVTSRGMGAEMSMSEKKPIPERVRDNTKICVVCGKRSYSPGGVHPQCAVRLAEAPRERELKAAKKLEAQSSPTKKPIRQTSWNKKKCPKCGLELHIRCRNCACGFRFFTG
jgi:hypothetical protein